jgi:glycosyl transferase family 4
MDVVPKARRVLHCIPTLGQGGAERMLVSFANSDDSVEHNIVCIFQGPVHFEPQCPVMSLGLPRHLGAAFLLPLAIIRFVRIVLRSAPDKLVGWLYYGALLATLGKLLGRPVIWSLHATALDVEHVRWATRCAIWLCRVSSWRVPEHIHCCSEEGRISHRAAGFCDTRAVVIDNVVDPRLLAEFR